MWQSKSSATRKGIVSTAGPALADDNQFLQTATCADLLISPAREPNAEHKDREHGHHDTDFEAALSAGVPDGLIFIGDADLTTR
jgi:hypothetical protein